MTSSVTAREPRRALTIVKAYFHAINAEDWPALEALFSPGAQLRAVGTRPRVGRNEVMAYFTNLFAPWSAHEDRLMRALPSASVVTAEVQFIGRTRDEQEVTFDAVDIFDVDNDQITSLTSWYDLVEVRRRLAI